MEAYDSRVLLTALIDYLSFSKLMQIKQTSKDMAALLNSRVVLGNLKAKYGHPDARSVDQLFSMYDKIDELVQAIKDDDVNTTLFILSYSIPFESRSRSISMLTPTVLELASVVKSMNVFTAVCSIMADEIKAIMLISGDNTETLSGYLYVVTRYVLESCDGDMYRIYFQMLDDYDDTDALFLLAIRGYYKLADIVMYSYAHMLATGDSSAFDVITSRHPAIDYTTDNLKRVYALTKSLELLKFFMDTNKYTNAELTPIILRGGFAKENSLAYLDGTISYEEAQANEQVLKEDKVLASLRRLGDI